MAYDIRSITQVGTSEPFELQVARGQILGHSFNHRFGATPSMSINTTGSIWDVNDTLYPWSALTTAGTVTVDRASTSDAGKIVEIVGLDANYNEVTDQVTLTAATGNASTQSFIRIYRAYMYNGSTTNVGNINIKRGATTVARITANKGQTLMAIYTVPAGYTAYLTQGVMTIQEGGDATGDMFVRYGGESAFRIGHSFEVASSEYHYGFAIPIRLPEKTDIDVRASVRSNNARVTAAFDMILIKEQGGL